MHNQFTAIIERDGDWFIANCPEESGAHGQGRTIEEARTSLDEAIALIQEHQEFEREVDRERQNKELMEFLDQRSKLRQTCTIEEARKILGIPDSDPLTENRAGCTGREWGHKIN